MMKTNICLFLVALFALSCGTASVSKPVFRPVKERSLTKLPRPVGEPPVPAYPKKAIEESTNSTVVDPTLSGILFLQFKVSMDQILP